MNRRLENENRRTAQVQSEYKATVKKVAPQIENQSKDGNSKAVNVIIIFLSALAVILFALLVRSIMKNNTKDNRPVENNNSQASVLELDLSVDGEFVQELYAKIPAGITGVEPYFSTPTKQEDIAETNKMAYILNKMMEQDNLENAVIEYSKVNEEYKKAYGSDKEAPKTDIAYLSWCSYEYDEQNEGYVRQITQNVSNLTTFKYRTNIEKVEKNDTNTEVYVFDSFICFDTTGDINNFGLYATSDKAITIETGLTRGHDSGKNEDIYGGKTVNELFNDYKEKYGKFKHTFKLDESNNYYWYSSEYIK